MAGIITPEIKAEIMSRIDILDVIGSFIELKKKGDYYVGLSPFNNEKTASFTVFTKTGTFKDFSSGKQGDTIQFLIEHEKMDYLEALAWLAKRYGITIPEKRLNPVEQAKYDLQTKIAAANQFASEYYEKCFWGEGKGSAGLAYMLYRGFSEEYLKKLRVGFSPSFHDLVDEFKSKGRFDVKFIETETGLFNRKSDNHAHYDVFVNRVVFPVVDMAGRTVAFSGRLMGWKKGDRIPKYYNTRETRLFKKGNILYGLYWAKEAIRKEGFCYIVEGFMDLLAMWEAGIFNVVASMGTAFNTKQVLLLKPYTSNFVLLFDPDQAGANAALRTAPMLLTLNGTVKIVDLPTKLDPQEFKNKFGEEGLREYLREHAEDMILKKARETLYTDNPVERSHAIDDLLQMICYIEDQLTRHAYIQEVSRISRIPLDILKNAEQKALNKKSASSEAREKKMSRDRAFFEQYKELHHQQNEESFKDGVVLKLTPEKELLRLILRFSKTSMKHRVNEEEVTSNIADYILDRLEHEQMMFTSTEDIELLLAIAKGRNIGRLCDVVTLKEDGYTGKLADALIQEKYSLAELKPKEYSIGGPLPKIIREVKLQMIPLSHENIKRKFDESPEGDQKERLGFALKAIRNIEKEWRK